jgi:hypothetical protein
MAHPHRFPLASQAPRKTKWTPDEDEQLRAAVQLFGTDSWNKISAFVPSRTGKQCRERWIGQLAPSVSKDNWSPDEDSTLVRAHEVTGNRWTSIACQLPGRSALGVKNRWNWLMRHNSLGIDAPNLTSASPPDVVETPKSQAVFGPLMINDGLFGAAFQQFQARMLAGFR